MRRLWGLLLPLGLTVLGGCGGGTPTVGPQQNTAERVQSILPIQSAQASGPASSPTSVAQVSTVVVLSSASVRDVTPAPAELPQPTITMIPTAVPTVTSTPTIPPTVTATATIAPTATTAPTPVPTATATSTPEPSPTPTQATMSPTEVDAEAAATPTPDRSAPAQVFRKLPTSDRVVALTFDAGADVGYTEQILDTLREENVRASFGLTGKWAEQNPELARRIVEDGHLLINHTYSHRSLTGASTPSNALSYDERAEELWKTHSVLLELTGASTKPYFRPPYGDYDEQALRDVRSRGYEYNIMWSVDSLGWKGLTRAEILERVLDSLEPGAIYLFHVGSQSQDGPALPSIISELRDRGYGFAGVDEYVGR